MNSHSSPLIHLASKKNLQSLLIVPLEEEARLEKSLAGCELELCSDVDGVLPVADGLAGVL